MEVLKFTLSGKTAFFKKPDINTYVNLTYNQIPRTQLLGILGAIVGYNGYGQTSEEELPEFYNKLKDLRIAVVPKKNVFDSKIQTFNNGTGLASNEKGGTLIVRQIWLSEPSWDIYIVLDNSESLKIKECLLNNKAEFIPYLGSNDHFANISNVSIENFSKAEVNTLDSLVLEDDVELKETTNSIYKEYLPVGLNKNKNYICRKMMSSKNKLDCKVDTYTNEKVNVVFYKAISWE